MLRTLSCFAVILASLLGFASTAPGQIIWYVDDNAPNDPGPGDNTISDPLEDGTLAHPFDRIQEAIATATNADTVSVAPGAYFETINFLGKAIVVQSTHGAGLTTIDAQGAGTAVRCVTGEGQGAILEGFTVTGGNAFEAGGMFNIDSSPQVIVCRFIDNFAWYGAGMYNRNSDAVITGCTFQDNTSFHGAGIWNDGDSQTTVTHCHFRHNVASVWGGGIVSAGLPSNMNVSNSSFCENGPDDVYQSNFVNGRGNVFSGSDCCPADVDDSGAVNVTDLLLVISLWGNPSGLGGAADINQDGLVNVTDLLAVISAWGGCP